MTKVLSRSVLLPALVLLAAFGCTEEPYEPGELGALTETRLDLAPMGDATDPAIGVTFDADGTLFALTRSGWLFEVTDAGFDLVWEPRAGIAPFGFTDVVSVGSGKFALSSRAEGFLLDVNEGTIEQHFCYLPDSEEWEGEEAEAMTQVSYALAFNGEKIIAQPQWTPEANLTDVRSSFFSVYNLETGDAEEWREAEPLSLAGGMAYVVDQERGARLLVGVGNTLSFADIWSDPSVASVETIGTLGLDHPVMATGMAVDRATDRLVYIDAIKNELRTLALSEVLSSSATR